MEERLTVNWEGKNYTAHWGAISYKGDARIVAKEIESIGDAVTAQDLVDYGMSHKESELYKCFEKDDKKAANMYRCTQAGSIMRNLKITIIEDDGTETKTDERMFLMCEPSGGKYEKAEVIIHNEDKYKTLLETAIDELREFERKYSRLKELNMVFSAIEML